ncbi:MULTISPECIES: histidine kinase [Nostoc]|uniref:Histidine kinase n=1 Tax=Nostoc paludosum FACHB-159 TaxID=2692908 RepID=A0ABR8KAH5_9NOSO|nr:MULTISPECIES: histidine kinase [Nostoc]MBD2678870.1 histidine kinase [Nostoc sp. FACHB-857]MBD2735248.1 histidine kinase [Nostoc paludosum FACHB-159]
MGHGGDEGHKRSCSKPFPFACQPFFHAQCPMPHAQCPMPND